METVDPGRARHRDVSGSLASDRPVPPPAASLRAGREALLRSPAPSAWDRTSLARQAAAVAEARRRTGAILMNILGISCFYHDAAAALVMNGQLVAAAEEERFSRKKHDSGFPLHAIRFCLEAGKLTTGDLDYVVFYEKPFTKFERILQTILRAYPRSARLFQDSMLHWLMDKLWIKSLIRQHVGVTADRILFSERHLSHAASAFFCS